jgi:23S rRNA pseudouridine2605 synthase
MAHAGVASRRACEGIIAAGRVTLNGAVVTMPGTKVLPGDKVVVDGKEIAPEAKKWYLALNKPAGYICSSSDPEGRPLALSLLPAEIHERLYNVGRLDFRSSGLIFFTNDGSFAEKVSHPGAELEKVYEVEAAGPIPDEFVDSFLAGIEIEGVFYKARKIVRKDKRLLTIVLIEGKNKEIRKVFSFFHLHPKTLRRVRIGPVELGELPEGECRQLSPAEITALETNSILPRSGKAEKEAQTW